MVLLAPDVPAVLLEMGFITNPEDEKALGGRRLTVKPGDGRRRGRHRQLLRRGKALRSALMTPHGLRSHAWIAGRGRALRRASSARSAPCRLDGAPGTPDATGLWRLAPRRSLKVACGRRSDPLQSEIRRPQLDGVRDAGRWIGHGGHRRPQSRSRWPASLSPIYSALAVPRPAGRVGAGGIPPADLHPRLCVGRHPDRRVRQGAPHLRALRPDPSGVGEGLPRRGGSQLLPARRAWTCKA